MISGQRPAFLKRNSSRASAYAVKIADQQREHRGDAGHDQAVEQRPAEARRRARTPPGSSPATRRGERGVVEHVGACAAGWRRPSSRTAPGSRPRSRRRRYGEHGRCGDRRRGSVRWSSGAHAGAPFVVAAPGRGVALRGPPLGPITSAPSSLTKTNATSGDVEEQDRPRTRRPARSGVGRLVERPASTASPPTPCCAPIEHVRQVEHRAARPAAGTAPPPAAPA